MKWFLFFAAFLAAGCCGSTIKAQCRLELQVTDNPEAKYRAQKICTAEGFTGTLEKTMCRSKERLIADDLPKACK